MNNSTNVTNASHIKKADAVLTPPTEPDLDSFLTAFYPRDDERIHFRAFKPAGAPDSDLNQPQVRTLTRAQMRAAGEAELHYVNHHRGIFFSPNKGGAADKDITRFNAVFVENDTRSIDEQHDALDMAPLPPSIRVVTRKSVHAYWLLEENCTAQEWCDLQARLIAYFDGDKAIKNPSRVMRLPGFMHLTWNPQVAGNYETHLVGLTNFNPESRFALPELSEAYPALRSAARRTSRPESPDRIIGNGSRNTTLFSMAGSMRKRGFRDNEIRVALLEANATRVTPPLEVAEVDSIIASVGRYPAGEVAHEVQADTLDVPRIPILDPGALYGLAGDVVRMIAPNTEADDAALLIQLLAAFGCLIGKTAHFIAEADLHFTKLFVVIFGASSKGRKGSSWGHIFRLLRRVDPSFANCVQDGMSSGEGLIFHVRDQSLKKTAVKKGGRIVDYQDEIVDEGAKEKRAFVIEPEFARVLRAMQREGNTLSSVIRQGWDTDRLRVLTKTPLIATETHISIIGHITLHELRRNLDETELANGFANRFLWLFATRSKELPFGGTLRESDLKDVILRLREAVDHARETKELTRNSEACELWSKVYSDLSRGGVGLVGSVTSRAEAQVMRLACLYALLECSNVIGSQHLSAALALWRYCEDSARYAFGNQTGDKMADTIDTAVRASEKGLTRTELRDLFQRNASSAQINRALKVLLELGRVSVRRVETDGRKAEIYATTTYDKNDQSAPEAGL